MLVTYKNDKKYIKDPELENKLENEILCKKLKAKVRHLEHDLDKPCSEYRKGQFSSLVGKLEYRTGKIKRLESKVEEFEKMIKRYLKTYRSDLSRVIIYRKITGKPLQECKAYVVDL